MLLMDATAQAVSLTSAENPAPTSIQVLIRTQEIKASEDIVKQSQQTPEGSTTFWGRVGQMFRDLWAAITGIFRS